jgi:hypothetical protein
MFPQAKLLLDATVSSSATLAAATYTSPAIDLLGVRFATIDVSATVVTAATQAGSPQTLKLQECDTSGGTYVDMVGFRGGPALSGSVDFVIGIGATAGQNAYKFNVDGRGRKRFLKVVAVPAVSTTFQVTANGFRVDQAPTTAPKANVLSMIEG